MSGYHGWITWVIIGLGILLRLAGFRRKREMSPQMSALVWIVIAIVGLLLWWFVSHPANRGI